MARSVIDVLKELIMDSDDPPTEDEALSELRTAGFNDIEPEEIDGLINEAANKLMAEAAIARAVAEFLQRHGYANLAEACEKLQCSPQEAYEQACREAGLLGETH